MPLEYSLTETEQVGSIIVIIAYILIIISGQQTKQDILQKQAGQEMNSNLPKPAQLVAVAGWVRVIGVLTLAFVASQRLKEREKNLANGEETGSIIPNVNINIGAESALISYIIEAIGTQQRAEEPGAIVTLV